MSDKPTVLIVEDDATQREMMASRFRQEGYDVTRASEAREALSTTDREPVDVIVSDIYMPGRSGLDLLRDVRGRFPVILVSGALTPSTVEEAMAGGATAVFPKPVTWPALLRAVDDAVGGDREGHRAVVADEHPATRDLLVRVLRREGYDVDLAVDGGEALEMALQAQPPYDLLITDFLIPNMSGAEVIRRIRGLDARTDIVFTARSGSSEQVRSCYPGEAVSVLKKPFDLGRLIFQLRRFKGEPAPGPAGDDTGVFSHWFERIRSAIRRDRGS